jgi:hypothetical protein
MKYDRLTRILKGKRENQFSSFFSVVRAVNPVLRNIQEEE